ncbi:flagellar filament capping protein FliD [Kineococcus sp. R86509]|uniref:flagellar filament capping protein FliD n=1 Tax=Kineococcus sp. R86509 TaxID=3093851 RepID=UPI0036D35C02
MSTVSSTSNAVDGLISGLDTTSIIAKLLSVDAAPQTQLKSNVSTAQTKVAALQGVNTRMSALQTAAQNLTKAATWTAAKATSTSDGVAVSASSTAVPGSLNVFVDQLASGRSVMTQAVATTAGDGTPVNIAQKLGFPLDVTDNQGNLLGTVDLSKGSFDDVAAAINKASSTLGIQAVAVRVSDGVYRLQITSTKTGASDGDFQLVSRPADPSAGNLQLTKLSDPADARLYITANPVTDASQIDDSAGSSNPAIKVTSSSNSFKDLMSGVTATVTKTGGATVSVATDTSAVASSVQALVDAANAALSQIATTTKAGTVGGDGSNAGAGALNGNSTLRSLKNQILTAVTSALGGTASAATYGVQSTREGTLSFDSGVFSKAYAADPKKTQQLLAPTSVDSTSSSVGIAERLLAVGKGATDKTSGSLTGAIAGQNNTITDLTKRISDYDLRLAAKKSYYQKYYSNLEVALGKLQSQSSWLSSQLSSLSSSR